jgi:Na+(H+)/acetate symporter ActP
VHDMGRDRNSPAGHSPSQGHGHARVRRVLVAIGLVCIALAVLGRGAGAQFWLTLTYTEAATAVLPALAYSLLWRGFTVRGLRWCVYGGTLVALVLLAFSPAVSGSPHALIPGADWSVFPLYSPGLVSIPAAFLLGAIGSRPARTPERPAPAPTEESAVAAGAGTAGAPAQ